MTSRSFKLKLLKDTSVLASPSSPSLPTSSTGEATGCVGIAVSYSHFVPVVSTGGIGCRWPLGPSLARSGCPEALLPAAFTPGMATPFSEVQAQHPVAVLPASFLSHIHHQQTCQHHCPTLVSITPMLCLPVATSGAPAFPCAFLSSSA